MKNSEFSEIELTLISEDLVTNYNFEGRLLGKAKFVDEKEENLPQEVIRIYKNKSGKFISYMEYSDRDEGIWNSKVFVSEELNLVEIREGLTREDYKFGSLLIKTVPSKILKTAFYRAIEKLDVV